MLLILTISRDGGLSSLGAVRDPENINEVQYAATLAPVLRILQRPQRAASVITAPRARYSREGLAVSLLAHLYSSAYIAGRGSKFFEEQKESKISGAIC